MRTTLTLLLAIALSLAVAVSSSYADATLYACKGKQGTKYRLVDSDTECKNNEDYVELTVGQATSATRLGPEVFEAMNFESTSTHLSCGLRDEFNDINVLTSLISRTFRVTCYKFSQDVSAIRTINADYQSLIANCVTPSGDIVTPEIMIIQCTLD